MLKQINNKSELTKVTTIRGQLQAHQSSIAEAITKLQAKFEGITVTLRSTIKLPLP